MTEEESAKAVIDNASLFGARVRAFRVTCRGIGDGIYFADSADKAKLYSLIDGRDAGYHVNFRDLRVRRAPDFDARTYLGKRWKRGIIPDYFDDT